MTVDLRLFLRSSLFLSLEIFIPHRHQCGLELHIGRLRESLTFPSSEQHHPVLMNAIYLWACYLSRPGQLSEHEAIYLSRAVRALNDAVEYPTKIVDLIQGSCLLSVYYLSNGQLFQGNFYATTAASLAAHCGLHQIHSDDLTPHANGVEWNPPFTLELPKDAVEQGERILTFWQVFNLDRCWSVALHRPAVLSDNNHRWTRISTPWPQRMEDYEAVSAHRCHVGVAAKVTHSFYQGEIDVTTDFATICALFKHQSENLGNFSTLALRTKVSALFESANRIASGWNARKTLLSVRTYHLLNIPQRYLPLVLSQKTFGCAKTPLHASRQHCYLYTKWEPLFPTTSSL